MQKEGLIMKRYVLLPVIMFVCFFCGCHKTENGLKRIDVKVDDSVSYKIYDLDKITETKQDGKIYVRTVKIPLEELKNFEENSYNKKFLTVAKNNQGTLYESLDNYLNSYDFSGNDYALHNNRFDSFDESGLNQKRFFNKPIIYNGKVIGELVYKDNAFHCFSYEFTYITKSHLYTTKIELYRINPSILENEHNYFEKKNNEFLPYHWISEAKRLQFYNILESNDFEKLPEEFRLLRMSKDLFLDSLSIMY